MTRRQAALAGGLVWEHYDRDWNVDWDHNRDDPKHLFRPWGFQPGHQAEWSKLLVLLHVHLGACSTAPAWLLPTARHLFDTALQHAWDVESGGIVYGFAPDYSLCDTDKYFWVQAESIAAAARLFAVTGDARYREWYERVWRYAWQHFVDHEHGAWYRILDRRNRKYGNDKSPAGKTDYHTMGACHDVLAVLRASPIPGAKA
jgi:mannose/cellobiose epimerase-like protein (N-acyl-D-glucosamine 2-epimerase family)